MVESTPTMGNKASGINDVAGMGIGSVIHQNATKAVIAEVQTIADVCPDCNRTKPTIRAKTGPAIKAQAFCIACSDSEVNGYLF